MDDEIVIGQGTIRGRHADGVRRFWAIPYAAPPYGANRFQAPAPPPSWDAIRDCTEFGPTALKPQQPDVFEALLPDPTIPGEDCLTVNVWTPDGARGLPVLVWVHGGGFMTGSSAVPIYDGSAFARHGVVVVTVNYRLGVDGFAAIPGAPANRGLLDVIAALEWVRDNIAAFGGDPARVTVAGQSAGAMAVITLLAMPASRGLLVRAIAQSGGGHHALTLATAERITAALCADLGVPCSVAGLAAVAPEPLFAAVEQLAARLPADPDPVWDELRERVLAFQPVIDGDSLPALPVQAVRDGAAADVGLLIGTNSDEFTLWSVPTGLADTIDDAALDAALAGFGLKPEARAVYEQARPAAAPDELYSDLMTDWAFRIPAVRVAEAHRGETYCYEFSWPSPLFGGRLRATHASEVAFSFDNLQVDWAVALRGDGAPQALADEVHGAFVAFIAVGDPGWGRYGAAREVRNFGGSGQLEPDPNGARRALWDGLR